MTTTTKMSSDAPEGTTRTFHSVLALQQRLNIGVVIIYPNYGYMLTITDLNYTKGS